MFDKEKAADITATIVLLVEALVQDALDNFDGTSDSCTGASAYSYREKLEILLGGDGGG